ncbi:MAG: acetyl/propionyl/methylcrotonyl-CoA carboxylase subunit alpha [Oleiphilaceae bacterium]|nr:acetyl/propionyl/methylcrotonyl-CoA carboxylase subunit alpha [Oleiphilaceae bacterium]
MSKQNHFEKILVANRGEIAVRVMRTAKSLGYRTVAIYSEADAHAPHVLMADEAVCIGPAAVGESYLVIDKVLEAARLTGAQAVHPGYGFLSENSAFANACEEAGIEFIGPPSDAIELMGSKRLSKIAMIEAGVPCIPGYEGEDQSLDTLVREAEGIGFPIMVKASAGGGGRGMRLVFEHSELEAQIKTARSEAENAFGSGELILEKAVIKPRHIEIQVFADKHGNAVYLGERDCSVQRRHQKVVEEAPSPFVDEELRQRMGEAAVKAALACNYVGAGTVEFLVDADKNFYFLEMNTRLQVEHPVTELVTGTDLVAWQLNVAAGQTLPLSQDQITLNGHAMEVRLYAEDPANQFLPQTGPVHLWQPATGEGVRIDGGIRSGQQISSFYDPMLAKIIAYGSNREEARRRLVRAIEDSTLFGVTVNSHFLCEVLRHENFIAGEATTAFIGEDFADNPSMHAQEPEPLAIALATLISFLEQRPQHDFTNELSGWSNTGQAPWPYQLKSGNHKWPITLELRGKEYVVRQGEHETVLQVISDDGKKLVYRQNGVRRSCVYHIAGAEVFLRLGSRYYVFEDATHAAISAQDGAGSGEIKASMDGAIIEVAAEVGAQVTKGQTLVILEAMKMEHPLKADVDGTISEVRVKAGDQVKLRQLLVTITPEGETAE